MRKSTYFFPLTVLTCLLLSACTEKTIIQEVPASGISDETGNTDPATGADANIQPGVGTVVPVVDPDFDLTDTVVVPVEPAPFIDGPSVVTDPVAQVPSSDPVTPTDPTTPTDPATPADPTTPDAPIDDTTTTIPPVTETDVIAGAPGLNVDCQLSIPCRWTSADTQFSVTVTNVDNIGRLGRLSIEYSVVTTHDSEITVASTENAADASGASYAATAINLGNGTGTSAQGVLAGNELLGNVEYGDASSAASLTRWSLGLSDAGLIRQPVFTNLPVGSVTTQIADCQNTLPCAWVPPNANVAITLLSVTGTGTANQLATYFHVVTNSATGVAVDAGATAVGTDGLSYSGRTHAIGLETSGLKVVANTVPGAQLSGGVFFSRTQSMSAALQNLSLIIYEDNPVPRWNPSFTNVPVQ